MTHNRHVRPNFDVARHLANARSGLADPGVLRKLQVRVHVGGRESRHLRALHRRTEWVCDNGTKIVSRDRDIPAIIFRVHVGQWRRVRRMRSLREALIGPRTARSKLGACIHAMGKV